MDTLKKLEKNNDISQDDQKIYSNDIQKLTDATIKIIDETLQKKTGEILSCLLYTSPSPRDRSRSRMPSSA